MIILGLVGTPAAGKSTAAQFLADQGAFWINADLIARSFLTLPAVVDGVRQRLGDDVVHSDGQLDRTQLAKHVFGVSKEYQENLQFLVSLLHHPTKQEIYRQLETAAERKTPVALLDVPLLFESDWDVCCDQIWCVDASRETRLQRILKRGWSPDQLAKREAMQTPIETKKRLSQVVMCNDATLAEFHEILARQWSQVAAMIDGLPNTNDRHCRSETGPNRS